MPASSNLGKDLIQDWVKKQLHIKTILDIGPGLGTYYDLLGKDYYWKAIEVWQENIDKFGLKEKYNEVICADVSKAKLPEADLIIFGDVLEHLPKRVASRILRKAILRYSHLIISIPLGKYVQGPIDGNEYETHLSTWNYQEIEDLTLWKVTKVYPINPLLPDLVQIGVFIK